MSAHDTPILKSPPEIFPVVASHIPLQHFPATLSALALTASQINRYVTHILYSKVVVRNLESAHQIIDRIFEDKELGLLVRELHILTNHVAFHSDETRPNDTRMMNKLHRAIIERLLPRMSQFNLVIAEENTYGSTMRSLKTYRLIDDRFWTDLKYCCPHLRGNFFRGSTRDMGDPSIFYELEKVSNSRESSIKIPAPEPPSPKLISSLAHSLHALTIIFPNRTDPQAIRSLLSNTFPHLGSFTVSCNEMKDISNAMDFWVRHPGLERLSLSTRDVRDLWFFDIDNYESLLPRLTHLKATFRNVIALARSHLGQLQHLSITYSANLQVPYLLRLVIPEGLPHLKSLEVFQQTTYMTGEDVLWFHRVNGDLVQGACGVELISKMPFAYIDTIAQRIPNVEELCLQSKTIEPQQFEHIQHYLAQFTRIRRFYFRAFRPAQRKLQTGDIDAFVSTCRIIATSCRTVKLITDISVIEYGQYLTGTVIRDAEGSVMEVVPGRGFGMEFTGGDKDPFPHNPLNF